MTPCSTVKMMNFCTVALALKVVGGLYRIRMTRGLSALEFQINDTKGAFTGPFSLGVT
jgi:hypothetical protein